MSNLLSYYGFVDLRISASDKDLPVIHIITSKVSPSISRIEYVNQFLPLPKRHLMNIVHVVHDVNERNAKLMSQDLVPRIVN